MILSREVISPLPNQDEVKREDTRLSPMLGLDTQVSDLSDNRNRVTEVDAYSQTDPEISEAPVDIESVKSFFTGIHGFSELNLTTIDTNISDYLDEFCTSKTEAELKGLCWSRDEELQNGGFPTQKSKSSLTLGKLLGPISDIERTDSNLSYMSTTGIVTSDIEGAFSRDNSLWWDRESTQGQTYESGKSTLVCLCVCSLTQLLL